MGFKRKYANIEDVLANTLRTESGCMEWQGAINKDGYAACNAYGLFKSQALHREVHRLHTGATPEVVMHSCDNRKCINPEHLVSGTPEANLLDKLVKNRQAQGAANGRAKLTPQAVLKIRELWSTGGPTYKEIGAKFGVSRATVWRVLSGTNWGSVCK
jgi:hypothetical protein